jgi:hypothetical protein
MLTAFLPLEKDSSAQESDQMSMTTAFRLIVVFIPIGGNYDGFVTVIWERTFAFRRSSRVG